MPDLRALALAVLDLGLPGRCAGCDGESQEALCGPCSARVVRGAWSPARVVAPDPSPPGLPPVVAAAPYAGVLRSLLTAYKDDGRRDLRPVLAGLLGRSLSPLVVPGTVLVPVPSARAARRRRGDAPLLALVDAARDTVAGRRDVLVLDALRVTRRVVDQAGLGRAARAANLAGAYDVRPAHLAALQGIDVVLVDDVVTTGATVAEAARALRAAGLRPVAVATVAATRRLAPPGTGPTPRSLSGDQRSSSGDARTGPRDTPWRVPRGR